MHPAMDHDAHNANTSSHSMEMRMPFVFSTDTRITIFFPRWTTSSITQYILTLVFLFMLAILNRFLGAFRFQLEQAWSNRESHLRKVETEVSGNRPPRSKRNALPVYTQVSESDDSVSTGRENSRREFYPWKSSGPWGLRKDGTRALLEFGRAFIGYVLMLAVMSFNVGVFAAVLLGVLCGELGLGRFSQGMAGW